MHSHEEKYGLVSLTKRKFARVFVPNTFYGSVFEQIDETHFATRHPSHGDLFVIDTIDLSWIPYGRRDGFDDMRLPGQDQRIQEERMAALQQLRAEVLDIASILEDSTIAILIANRVVDRIESVTIGQPVSLRELIEEERKMLRGVEK